MPCFHQSDASLFQPTDSEEQGIDVAIPLREVQTVHLLCPQFRFLGRAAGQLFKAFDARL